MRILGIDYGDKKIGLAMGDSQARVAVPLEVIGNRGQDTILELARRIETEGIDGVVVGVPLSTGGHHGSEQLAKTRAFIESLRLAVTVSIEESDESYTTAESIRLQREDGARANEDALAAMLILQAYFERL